MSRTSEMERTTDKADFKSRIGAVSRFAAALVIRLATVNVSLATTIGLSLCCFVSGIIARDYWKEKAHDTFISGYQTRDIEAYGNFVNRPQARWKIVGIGIGTGAAAGIDSRRKTYDIELAGGQVMRNFIPCEDPGWYIGLVILGAGYYNRGSCMSFQGPQAYIFTEPGKILQTTQTKGRPQTQ